MSQKVTLEQFAYFQRVYDQEVARHARLVDRGKVYLSVMTLYLGLTGLSLDRFLGEANMNIGGTALYVFGLLILAVASVFVVRSLGIYRYVYPSDPVTIIKVGNPNWPDNEEFFTQRAAEIAAAFEHNHPVNEKRATSLKYASVLMVIGVFMQITAAVASFTKW